MIGRLPPRLWFVAPFALIAVIAAAYVHFTTLRGVVYAGGIPIAGAIVRAQGTTNATLTDARGAFTLTVAPFSGEQHITAWAEGYYISHASGTPPITFALELRAHPTADNAAYSFISPFDATTTSACGRCHAARSGGTPLPVDEWGDDAHANAAVNPRFLSLYNGTTLAGITGTLTAYQFDAAAGIDVPLTAEDANIGFRLDFPDAVGSCAACHVPVLALDQRGTGDPNTAHGVAAEGITCDFCHKIAGVRLGADGSPSLHFPGVQSMELLRPAEGEQVFLGPFDDTPGDDIFAPLQTQSQVCAACHSGGFWGERLYNSFGEWLASPYSDPVTGSTCQDCHMPRTGATTFVELPPDVNQFVPERDPNTIFSHRMPGASDMALLRSTAELTLDARRGADELAVSVTVMNTGAGHSIPTDSPLRNLILLVEARAANGDLLPLRDGAIIPAWGGIGNPAAGFYAGLPGVLYAKILADSYTGETPTFAYWRQTRLVSDNRIAALASDTSAYRFALPADAGAVTVTARLYLRRAFIDLMAAKGWNTPDILMEEALQVIP